ncbi:MAG TPA: DUF5615 family PIN-like protein [Phycisphaerae bacterium]|nr:DUF5615 family PIN-like protein [Phycisphaerae bacterium]
MNLSPLWCDALQAHGHVCTHWSEVGDPRAPDDAIMRWASDHGHVVLTHDLDFGALSRRDAGLGAERDPVANARRFPFGIGVPPREAPWRIRGAA